MKKVLLLTYYWPPAGGPGVQRWLKFVKYLPDFGIEPIVYAPENAFYPLLDDSLTQEIPENLVQVKTKIFEPYRWAKLVSKSKTKTISSGIIATQKNQSLLEKVFVYIRGNFFIPDARKFWIKPSVKFLKTYLSENQIDTVITTGPPHSLHLIGWELKKIMPFTWIADFRDPWTEIGYHKKLKLSSSSRKKHEQLEKKVLNSADWLLTTSFTTQAEFEKKTDTPVSVITNGYEDEIQGDVALDKAFSLSHIGNLLQGRNPENLWLALQELTEEDADFKKALSLQFIGKISKDVQASIEKHNLQEFVRLEGYVPHKKAVEFQKKSQVLLLIEVDSKETRGIIPGKLFEYLNAQRPLLAIGPENWDVDKILAETQIPSSFSYGDKAGIKNQIRSYFTDFQAGSLHSTAQNITRFHRKNLTEKLAEKIFQASEKTQSNS